MRQIGSFPQIRVNNILNLFEPPDLVILGNMDVHLKSLRIFQAGLRIMPGGHLVNET